MKYTLLELVQEVLSSMDSDEVNSITDSTESLQVAKVIRSTYFSILERANLPEHYGLVNLTASGDSTKPVQMTLPSDVNELLWLKYNKETATDTDLNMVPVDYMALPDFLSMTYMLSESDTNVDTMTHTAGAHSYTFMYRNDKAPDYYTAFDDGTLIFDSYDNTVDTTLQSSKTLGYARLVIPFTMSNTFTPDLDENQFNLLLNEAKALAWAELKQAQHAKAEQTARRGWVTLQKNKEAVDKRSFFDKLPNYGRK